MILLCGTVEDRLIIINWCVQLSSQQQKDRWIVYKKDFAKPTVSAEIKVAFNPRLPRLAGALDQAPQRQECLERSQSLQAANKKQKRKATDTVATDSQMRDQHTQGAENKVTKISNFNELM